MWINNDPHFWSDPPTWGIYRNDLRQAIDPGDFVFFVFPRQACHPRMIFGYMQVAEKITHREAYHRPDLLSKRMGRKSPNGNIIVDANGNYSRFDGGVHAHIFDRIKNHYIVGVPSSSRMLDDKVIRLLAPRFLSKLKSIVHIAGSRAIDIISRKGRRLNENQVKKLLTWLASA